ncbi:hypothetical protein NWFMUON74_68880 [Nocardia wallacei]|uniref:Uncharacterized protein n=1 Tax=Nocardia wallacei TaxID=480035 RepID=A0A7G1KWX8_9NOCA|nr:hypothetical protein NWFMUON74_68880 [Nocardia wallacei]
MPLHMQRDQGAINQLFEYREDFVGFDSIVCSRTTVVFCRVRADRGNCIAIRAASYREVSAASHIETRRKYGQTFEQQLFFGTAQLE